jgi:FMN-dependent NADH-azoreductase
MTTILHIDASSQSAPNSISRKLSNSLVERLSDENTSVIYRDVSQGLPFVSEFMIGAYFTPAEDRSDEQNQAIALSNEIVAEIAASDIVVLGAPMYNFSAPATLKAWADLVARVGVTFQYTENGPVGLLENKKAYVAVATGGVPIDSPVDFLTPWLRQFLGFLGIADVEIIGAEALTSNAEAAVQGAEDAIKNLTV